MRRIARFVACAVVVALSAAWSARAQCNQCPSFDDEYWNATCPDQQFSAGCHRWHLCDEDAPKADIRVCPVWDMGYTGAGITIGIVDTGVRITHEDLADKYNEAASTEHCDLQIIYCWGHGTMIAGLAVGAANNEVGIVGVVYGASFAEIVSYIDEQQEVDCSPCEDFGVRIPTSDELSRALRSAIDLNDIKSFSLAGGLRYVLMFDDCADPQDCVVQAIEEAATEGRDGLGTVLVVSAGNAALDGARTDYSRFTSHRYTIAVGAYTHEDVHWCGSNPGSSLFIVGPSGDSSECDAGGGVPPWTIWTTAGTGDTNYGGTAGTSFSTPIVAGVVALMLEADADVGDGPRMSVRDVMHAFANTARRLDANDAGWETNNGTPDHDIHYNYGFGAVDAEAAVEWVIDEDWRRALSEREIDSGVISVNTQIAGSNSHTATFTVQTGVAGNHLRVEHVEVTLNTSIVQIGEGFGEGTTMTMGDLRVTILGPEINNSRTESLVADFREGETTSAYEDVVFTTVRHWDKPAVGAWSVKLENQGATSR